jgi:predicted small lipoprotein YifL
MSAMLRPPVVLILLLIALTGCGKEGPQIAPVHGRVTLDGQPLANADVMFQPEGAQRASTGRTDGQGRYELAYKRGQMGAIVGPHTARIEVSSELVRNPPPIPARYASKSELHPEVKPGDNEFNFDVTTEKK